MITRMTNDNNVEESEGGSSSSAAGGGGEGPGCGRQAGSSLLGPRVVVASPSHRHSPTTPPSALHQQPCHQHNPQHGVITNRGQHDGRERF